LVNSVAGALTPVLRAVRASAEAAPPFVSSGQALRERIHNRIFRLFEVREPKDCLWLVPFRRLLPTCHTGGLLAAKVATKYVGDGWSAFWANRSKSRINSLAGIGPTQTVSGFQEINEAFGDRALSDTAENRSKRVILISGRM
jgi:hypothetical protein